MGIDSSNESKELDLAKHQSHVNTEWKRLIDRLFNEIRSYGKSKNMRFMDLHLMYANFLIKNNEFERSTHRRFNRSYIDSEGEAMVKELLKRIC